MQLGKQQTCTASLGQWHWPGQLACTALRLNQKVSTLCNSPSTESTYISRILSVFKANPDCQACHVQGLFEPIERGRSKRPNTQPTRFVAEPANGAAVEAVRKAAALTVSQRKVGLALGMGLVHAARCCATIIWPDLGCDLASPARGHQGALPPRCPR